MGTPDHWPSIVVAGAHDPATLSRANSRGTLRRLAHGLYTGDVEREPADVVKAELPAIVAAMLPGAVFVDRSATGGGLVADGEVYVDHGRRRPLELPGLVIRPRRGPGPQPGDLELPGGIWRSSTARALLDNLAGTVAGPRVLGRARVEEWLERIARHGGERQLRQLRDEARRLAPALRREQQFEILDGLIATTLGTGDVALLAPALRARAAGAAYDPDRTAALDVLADMLADRAPTIVPALVTDEPRRALLPFYEAYFSNFIEGTEFTTDEAAQIVFEKFVPGNRPADAHDITGTYELVSDTHEMRRRPRDADEFLELLRARHAVLLGARPEVRPGRFKERDNRAGATLFVAADLVEGTLRAGFEIGERVEGAFARAAYAMFLVSEVHPFADGNGRIARIMMNVELVAAAESRIIIPTVYRNNYLLALKGATNNRHFDGMLSMLSFAQRYTARVNFSDRATAEADLARTNAFRDPVEADNAGIRLELP